MTHEEKMYYLHKKAMKEKREAERAIIKYTAMFLVLCPFVIAGLKLAIDFAWAYSYATRGF